MFSRSVLWYYVPISKERPGRLFTPFVLHATVNPVCKLADHVDTVSLHGSFTII
jgi:hypothetical protein